MLLSFAEQNPSYIEISENFTSQTLISASEAIIKSSGISKGRYIEAPNMSCKITSNLYRYARIHVSKFQSQLPKAEYYMEIVDDQTIIQAENNFSHKKFNITHNQNFDIRMTRSVYTSTKIRFRMKIKGMFYLCK